jgi:hypothetical protein
MVNGMDKRYDFSLTGDVDLPQPDAAELRGRQSVRATFKLSARAIDALSIVAMHLGIKQKSLFDHLIEDVQTLNVIAKEVEAEGFKSLSRVQKTFVISRRTLASLDEISRQFRAPRDALVEYSIQRLLPVLQREREKHRRRKMLLVEIDRHYQQGVTLLEQSVSELGEDDPVSGRLAAAMEAYTAVRDQIAHFVAKADAIEEF